MFTSSATPSIPVWEPTGSCDRDTGNAGVAGGSSGGDNEPLPLPTCKGSHVSVVNIDASWGSRQLCVCTGEEACNGKGWHQILLWSSVEELSTVA